MGRDEQGDMQGKTIILIIVQDDVSDGITVALKGLPVYIQQAHSAQDALNFLEDYRVDLLITEPQLADMHSLQLIYKVKETFGLRGLPIAIIADSTNITPPMPNVEYLMRPISITQIRQRVCDLLP
jgi:two-component SAPR family response regulator